jgi:hypothetical protein
MGGSDNRQILADVYRASSDAAVKRSIIRSFMVSGDRTRLLSLAKTETEPGCAAKRSSSSASWARTPSSPSSTHRDVGRRQEAIIQAMFVGGSADKLIELAKNEKDMTLRRTAVRNLGLMGSSKTAEAIKAIYLASDSDA